MAVALMEGFDFVVLLVEGLILSAVGIQLTLVVVCLRRWDLVMEASDLGF